MSTEPLLTPKQTSRILGVTTDTLAVWRCRKRYALTFIKVGRKVMYRSSDIDRFLKRRTKGETTDE
ncbi:MAG TPA: helix-turn-helix domain-containing protein [Steroidobacteraceae bacterium]|nr:helix-turn-helix domain-containing protein [Steroidobacteraceae bacterium]